MEEALGSAFVLAALHEDIQGVTVLVDGTPKILTLALSGSQQDSGHGLCCASLSV